MESSAIESPAKESLLERSAQLCSYEIMEGQVRYSEQRPLFYIEETFADQVSGGPSIRN